MKSEGLAAGRLASCVSRRDSKNKRNMLRLRAAEAALAAGRAELGVAPHQNPSWWLGPAPSPPWNALCRAMTTAGQSITKVSSLVGELAEKVEESLAMRLSKGHVQAGLGKFVLILEYDRKNQVLRTGAIQERIPTRAPVADSRSPCRSAAISSYS